MKQQEDQSRQPNHVKKVLLIVVLLLLIVGGFYGIYSWQHKKLNTSNATSTKLQTKVKTLNGQVLDLQTKYKRAATTVTQLESGTGSTQEDFTLTLNGSMYVNPFGSGTSLNSTAYVGVNITLTNPTKDSVGLTIDSFKLKDAQNDVYRVYSPSYVQNSGLPAGYVTLTDQTLQSKETVKGALIFQLPNNSLHSFTLTNGSSSYSVKTP